MGALFGDYKYGITCDVPTTIQRCGRGSRLATNTAIFIRPRLPDCWSVNKFFDEAATNWNEHGEDNPTLRGMSPWRDYAADKTLDGKSNMLSRFFTHPL